LHELLCREIPIFFLDGRGKFLGRLVTPASYQLPLRQQQYLRNSDAQFELAFARQVVTAKIHNQHIQALRWARRQADMSGEEADHLNGYEAEARKADDLESLLGIEGSAARLYFGLMQRAVEPEWNFAGRNRRPPRDPINAMLSLGYTFLTLSITAALEIVGLDPYLGYFHKESYGKPALALDLVEEFRAPLVDSMVVSLANHRRITPKDFTPGGQQGNAVYLKRPALRIFGQEYLGKLESEISPREIGHKLSYQKLFEVQARRLARWIKGETDTYLPFRAR